MFIQIAVSNTVLSIHQTITVNYIQCTCQKLEIILRHTLKTLKNTFEGYRLAYLQPILKNAANEE